MNRDDDVKRLFTKHYYLKHYLPKGIAKNYHVIINRKKLYYQLVDSNIKRYKEIRKLTIGQDKDYITGCLLDYKCIKNHYRLIAVDFRRQKELDADPKAIYQIQFVVQLKEVDSVNTHDAESIFVLTISEKIKKNMAKILLRKCNSLIKDGI